MAAPTLIELRPLPAGWSLAIHQDSHATGGQWFGVLRSESQDRARLSIVGDTGDEPAHPARLRDMASNWIEDFQTRSRDHGARGS